MISKKSESANLENKRAIFMETGMIISLVIVILAINWKTYDKRSLASYQGSFENIPEELVPITTQKPPEPPKVNMPAVITAINMVDDDIEVDDDILINAEADQMDTVEVYVPVPVMKEESGPAEEEIFRVVESMPAFPGGEAALYEYISKSLKYPMVAREASISGKVFVAFVVEKDGSITDVELLRGIGGGCDEEALRVVKGMPKWIPGKQRGIPVRVHFNLSVRFTLASM